MGIVSCAECEFRDKRVNWCRAKVPECMATEEGEAKWPTVDPARDGCGEGKLCEPEKNPEKKSEKKK